MRQGSTCTSWEPTRCPTYSRNNSKSDASDLKGSTYDNSFDSLKALPTRPKVPQGPQYNQKSRCPVEENRLRNANKTQTGVANHSTLAINRSAPNIEVNVARSRCHPRRRPCPDSAPATTPKLRRDTDCTDAIVRLIVYFSTKLVHTIWSQASVTPKASKDFNGGGVLPLQVFIQETLRRSKTSYSTLQVALYYLILLRPHVKPCQATQQQYTPGCRALQCGRRMFLTALILASKYLQDRNYSARAWSKISGLPVAEINENERHYLELIKYNLHMSKESFESWSRVVLSICKTSGHGPNGGKPDSPPSSPDSFSYSNSSEPGSSTWWTYHLARLTPDMVKSSKATEEYIAGLATCTPLVEPTLSLDTPPSSPESLEEVLTSHSSPVVIASSTPRQALTPVTLSERGDSPGYVGSVPPRPVPANLPTPQTTPRHDSAFTFSRQSSQTDLRCRASQQALGVVDKQVVNQANLETCPPPKPRFCAATTSHPLRESAEPTVASWMSSPESSFSDCSSFKTRSRSSSISSVSSVWSVPGNCLGQNESKPTLVSRSDSQSQCLPSQPQSRCNMGSYSFYHPVASMHSIPEDVKSSSRPSNGCSASLQRCAMPRSAPCKPESKSGDLNENQISQLLASLSSQSDSQVQNRNDPAVVGSNGDQTCNRINIGPGKKHKRNRPSKEDNILQEEVRQFLWNEQIRVCVEDDKSPTACVETSDKQAQYPLQDWAHPKKPVPNAMHTKRIALQHTSSEEKSAPELATEYLRQSVAVM